MPLEIFKPLADTVQSEKSECRTLLQKYGAVVLVTSAAAVLSSFKGPHVGAFCQVMDIFISEYGKLEIDSDVLCVRFLYEKKLKFEKKNFFSI